MDWTVTDVLSKAKSKELTRAIRSLENLQYADARDCDTFGRMIFVPMFPMKATCAEPREIMQRIGEKHKFTVSKKTLASVLADLEAGYREAVEFVPTRAA